MTNEQFLDHCTREFRRVAEDTLVRWHDFQISGAMMYPNFRPDVHFVIEQTWQFEPNER